MAVITIVDPVLGLYQKLAEPNETPSFDVGAGVTTTGISGGGGVTVIDDGGTLTGTYEGDVLCKGNATLAGNVTVQGKLTVLSTLTNNAGYQLIVNGDLIVLDNFDFNHSDPNAVQSNVTVDGNFIIKGYYLNFLQGGASEATLRVGGDLISSNGFTGTQIDAYGNNNTAGLDIVVYGDMSGFSSVNIYGGDATAGGQGGAGGDLEIYGNYTGQGHIDMYGGEGLTFGNGGNGGFLNCYGNLALGSVPVMPPVFSESYEIRIYGGNAQDNNAGAGGNFYCKNNLVAKTVDTHGGSATLGSTGGSGGNGGTIYVIGNCVSSFDSHGGDGVGLAGSAYGGNGGEVIFGGSVTSDTIYTYGGQCIDGFAAGIGGALVAANNISVGEIDTIGGVSVNCLAGNGGSIDVNGIISTNIPEDGLTISTEGGTCTSTSNDHTAGDGGSITCAALMWADSTIVTSGGSRLGTTTSAGAGAAGSTAGNITVYGDMIVSELYMSGGDVNTEYKSFVGGAGGTLTVNGSLTVQSVAELLGGNSRSYNGGVSGRVYVNGGPANCGNLTIQGGASNPASSGGDPSTNRGSVRDSSFRRGINAQSFIYKDGSVGSSPTDAAILQIAGSCNINSLDVENRAEVKVKGTGDLPIVLKLGSLPGKTTLTKGDDTETADISAQLNTSIFHYSADGNWYACLGFSV